MARSQPTDAPPAAPPDPAALAAACFAEFADLAVADAVTAALERAATRESTDRFSLIDSVADRLARCFGKNKHHLARSLRDGSPIGLIRVLALLGLDWAECGGFPRPGRSGHAADLLACRMIDRIRGELGNGSADSTGQDRPSITPRELETLRRLFTGHWTIRRQLLDGGERLDTFEAITRRPEIAELDGTLTRRQFAERLDRIDRDWGDAYANYLQVSDRLRDAGFADLP